MKFVAVRQAHGEAIRRVHPEPVEGYILRVSFDYAQDRLVEGLRVLLARSGNGALPTNINLSPYR